jgi:hypothetical protein
MGDSTDELRRKLDRGADPNLIKDGFTPVQVAAKWGNERQVDLLLKAGAKGEDGVKEAIFWRQPGVLRTLIDYGVDLSTFDFDGQTPLHRAAELVYPEIVRIMLEAGVDPNFSDKKGNRPLHLVMRKRPPQVGDCLIREYDGIYVFHDGDVWRDTTEILLIHGADPLLSDSLGKTPLYRAFEQGRLKAAAVLCAAGSDLEAQNFEYDTPFLTAKTLGYSDIAGFLAEHRNYPVHLAAFAGGDGEFIKWLSVKGITGIPFTDDGHTPLHYAASYTEDVFPLIALIEIGADINHKDKDGDTCLHFAAELGHAAQVKALINAGALIELKNNLGLTPLDSARRKASESWTVKGDRHLAHDLKDNYSIIVSMLEKGAC